MKKIFMLLLLVSLTVLFLGCSANNNHVEENVETISMSFIDIIDLPSEVRLYMEGRLDQKGLHQYYLEGQNVIATYFMLVEENKHIYKIEEHKNYILLLTVESFDKFPPVTVVYQKIEKPIKVQ